tara:strand:+ start:403 stop:3261 length:2859 start_codon:yes stop_codon:yes gene_type:complete
MYSRLAFILFFTCFFSINLAQTKENFDPESIMKNSIEHNFEFNYGKGWIFSWNINSTPHRIFGSKVSQNFDANDPIDSEYAARNFISNNQSIYNIEESNLDLWVNEKHGSMRYLIFNQVYYNIPVWNGKIDFRYKLNGDLVMTGNDAFPDLSVDINPAINSISSISYAKENIGFDENLGDTVEGDPELFIWVEKSKDPIYHLAWLVELFVNSTDPEDHVPVHRWKVFVDAHNGAILDKFDEVRMATLDGHVKANVKDEPYGLATERGMAHVKVSVSGVGETYTDEEGYYSIDIGDVDRSVNVKLEGRYLNINNQNGSDASLTRTVSPGTTEDFIFGNLGSVAGERDTYFHANLIHDHVKSIDNSFTGGDYIMPAKVNIGSEDSYWPCNAYWDYTGINMFSEGGGCAATDQMADVVYHEYGHGLQQFIYDPYSPNYNSSGLSEGCSDYWGMTLTNTPCLGNGFFGEGSCLRDGNNTRQYPASSCGGSVHCFGEYIMGSLWKMRENLIELHGYENGVAISDNLFYVAQTGRPSNDIDFLYEIFLADDNDGNLQNGTANYNQICSAFDTHNLSINDLPDCDAAFASLDLSAPALDFNLAAEESDSKEVIISNVGEQGSLMYFSAGVSPFSTIGDGPDNSGNFWSDSDIDVDIEYNWIDIESVGNQYSFPGNDESGDQIDIGFDFPFLGQSYSQFFINANGWIGFGSDSDAWENTSIPSSSAPGPAIFGLWDDLNPVNDNCNSYCSGNVYYYGDDDKFVVWFNEVAHWWTNFENSFYDFQIVIYKDGKINMNYNTLTGIYSSATIGIQNSSGTDGLQVAFDQDYLQNALSIKFSQGPEWVTVSPSNGEVASGASEILTITADATGQPEGLYEGYMRLVTGGGNAGVPVTMLVSGESFQAGDINNDQSINVQDVIFLLNFILGTDTFDTPQFNAADINEDDVLNIQDVILLVNIIIG